MVALVDALSCNELDRDQIDILSLGCGDSEMTMSDAQVLRGGLWHWRDIVSSAMHLSSQNALGQAGLLIGRDRLIRLNAPLLPGGLIGLDDVKRAKAELWQDGKVKFVEVKEPSDSFHASQARLITKLLLPLGFEAGLAEVRKIS